MAGIGSEIALSCPPVKLCSICKVAKPLSEFHRLHDGYQYSCKACLHARRLARKAADPAEFRRRQRAINIKFAYGIGQQDFEDMKSAQGGRCALCSRPQEKLVIDHDHSSGKVRGLLCSRCNTGLGKFLDDVELLDKAIKYLTRRQPAA